MANLFPLGVSYIPPWAKLRTCWSCRICEVRPASALRCKRTYTKWAGYSFSKGGKVTQAHFFRTHRSFFVGSLYKIIFPELAILYLGISFQTGPIPTAFYTD